MIAECAEKKLFGIERQIRNLAPVDSYAPVFNGSGAVVLRAGDCNGNQLVHQGTNLRIQAHKSSVTVTFQRNVTFSGRQSTGPTRCCKPAPQRIKSARSPSG